MRSYSRWLSFVVMVAVIAATAVPTLFAADSRPIARISVSNSGAQANENSDSPSVSREAGRVAFRSIASNLVAGDTAGFIDVFVRDLTAGSTSRVSVATDGTQANADCENPVMDGSGTHVFFTSAATNLVPGDVNSAQDIFVRDLEIDATGRVSYGNDGSEANDNSYWPSPSEDGNLVAFVSDATNLVAVDSNSAPDVFLRDRDAGTTTLVSVSSAEIQGGAASSEPAMSGEGGHVAFESVADNLVGADGNGVQDVFVRDLRAGTTVRVSVGPLGVEGNGTSGKPSISADGSRVAFESIAPNLVVADDNGIRDVFVRDLETGETKRVSVESDGSEALGISQNPHISADGRYVAFQSQAALEVGDNNTDWDVYVHDLETGEVARVSLSTLGGDPNAGSGGPFVSPGGRWTAFSSGASNLIEGDSNNFSDVFLAPTGPREFVRVAGLDRYLTAIEASKRAYPESGVADYVVIATGRNWPDALGGSALAGVVGGPLLLSGPDALPASVSTEIGRLGATKAYILGGEGAISPQVEVELGALLGPLNVTRLAGPDRYATAREVADEVIVLQGGGFDKIALVATGGNYPDALAGSPLAANHGWPILLAHPTQDTLYLPAAVEEVVILGGSGAVSSQVESDLKGALGSGAVVRRGGSDRYATASLVAEYGVAQGARWDNVGVATGQNFPDALSGGAMLGAKDSVLLLSRTSTLSSSAQGSLEEHASTIGTLHIIGGVGAVSNSVEDAIKATVGE